MNYSFENIDIILLAMIAGFIFLRLRGILGKRTGHEENMTASFAHESPPKKATKILNKDNFDDSAKKEFLKGAKIAYENIITCFSSGNLQDIKSLLDKKVLGEFTDAINQRKGQGLKSETTFIGINSADIKNHNEINNMLEVSVDFVSEIISCVKDKDNKIVSGNPEKIKKVYDTWKFSRSIKSASPNWLLIDTQA